MVIIDDRPDLHVLIGRRRPGPWVGGMIVYPGGAVDPEDRTPEAIATVKDIRVEGLGEDEAAANLVAAIRETEEEVGLVLTEPDGTIDAGRFPHIGHWLTPPGPPRRYNVHFFLARHPGGEPVADHEEFDEVWWERPADILDHLESGELTAMGPTVSFVDALSRYRNVDDAFTATRTGIRHHFPLGLTKF